MGADEFIVSSDEEQVKNNKGKLDVILNTVSANFDLKLY